MNAPIMIPRHSWPADLLRWMGFIALFVALPVYLGVAGLERFVEDEFRPMLARRTADLETWLNQFRHPDFPEMGLEAWLNSLGNRGDICLDPLRRLAGRVLDGAVPGLPGPTLFDTLEPAILWEPVFLSLCERWLPDLQRTFPGAFEFVVFDGRGGVVERCSTPELITGRRAEWERFCRQRAAGRGADRALLAGEIARWRDLLGPLISDHPEQLEQLFSGGRFQVGFHPRRQRMVLTLRRQGWPQVAAFLSITPDWEAIGPCLGVMGTIASLEGGSWGLVDLRAPETRWHEGFNEPLPGIASAVIALGRSEGQACRVGDRWWAQKILTPHHRLLVSIADPVTTWREEGRFRLHMFAWLLILLGALGGLPYLVGRPPRPLSLRWKLVLLFLYAAGVPLGLLASATGSLLQERRAVRIRDRHDAQERLLSTLDRGYFRYFARKARGVRQHLEGPVPDDWTVDHPDLHACLTTLKRTFSPNLCLVFDERGRARSITIPGMEPTSQQLVDGIAAAMAPLLAQVISDENGRETTVSGTVREQLVKSSAESIGLDVERVVAVLRRRLDFLSEQVLIKPSMSGCFRMRSIDGRVRFLVLVNWMQMSEEPFYLEKAIPGLRSRFPDTVFQVSGYTGDILKLNRFQFRSRANQLAVALETQATPMRLEFVENGQVFLLTGIRGRFLQQNPMFAISPEVAIAAAGRTMGWRLGAAGAIILGLILTLGFLVARRLLQPLGDLGRGLADLQARRFRARLPVRSSDELGHMIGTFNLMMESLEGLEVGRAVQEALFPARPLVTEGWSLFGATVSASRVGGDYFDYFPLPDGRWFLTIGDVSGHGVSAALVVGLAKGLVAHPDTPRGEPGLVLGLLNQVILSTLARRKMMTCQVGVFDPRTGHLVLGNAGHCRPYLVGPHGAEEVVMEGRVIGFKATEKQPFPTLELNLAADQVLVFFTDGLVEAPIATPSPEAQESEALVGYDRFQAMLPSLRQADAAATAGAIRSWLTGQAGSGELPDDVTILVLQGAPGQPCPE